MKIRLDWYGRFIEIDGCMILIIFIWLVR